MAVVARGSTGCGCSSVLWSLSPASAPGLGPTAERLELERTRPEPLVPAVADVSARCSGEKPGRDEIEPRCRTEA